MNHLQIMKQRIRNGYIYYFLLLLALSSSLWLLSSFSIKNAEKSPTNHLTIKNNNLSQNRKSMITHSVFFTLKHPKGSAEEKKFFEAASKLATIPGVQHFERVQQISTKNKFTYGLTMQFTTQANYTAYTNHPDHTQFVKAYWANNVADFMEIDYVSF